MFGGIGPVGHLWNGGFAGINEEGINTLNSNLDGYCQEIQDIINGFDETGDITSALKGRIQEAAQEFIKAIKDLLTAYVSTIKKEQDEALDAYRRYSEQTEELSTKVEADADDIRAQAQQIRLD